MKISLYNVSKKASNLSFAENITITELDLLNLVGIVGVNFAKVSGVIEYMNSQFFLTMKADVNLELVCDRCLSKYDVDKTYNISGLVTENEDSIEGILVENGKLDIEKVLIDEIMMSMSMKSLCSDECLGLCTICGINLNKDECECENDEIDPRLSGLLDFIN